MKKKGILTAIILFALFNIGLSQSLVAHYPFNENTDDASGNDLHGSLYGATLTADRFGNANNAYVFEQGQTIVVADNDLLDGMDEGFTLAFWAKIPPVTQGSNVLINKAKHCHMGADDDAYVLRVRNDGTLWAQIASTGNGAGIYQLGTINVADSTWHHIALLWNKPDFMSYVDCVPDLMGEYIPYAENILNSPEELVFGQELVNYCFGETYSYGEALDDIRIYDYALSASELNEICQFNPVSAKQLRKKTEIVLFPNPTANLISCSQLLNQATVFNSQGNAVMEFGNAFSISVEHLPAGLYKLVFQLQDGQWGAETFSVVR